MQFESERTVKGNALFAPLTMLSQNLSHRMLQGMQLYNLEVKLACPPHVSNGTEGESCLNLSRHLPSVSSLLQVLK